MKMLLIPLAVLVLLTSGCTIPGVGIEIPCVVPGLCGDVTEFQHDVIVIESLTATPYTEMRSGQTLTLKAVVKNLQSPENDPRTNVKIMLYNTCGIFTPIQPESSCRAAASNTEWTSWSQTDGYTCTISNLYPQSTAIIDWRLNANKVNVQTPCDVGVLVEYDFTTPTTYSVTFINQEELENIVNQGGSVAEYGKTVVGEGPVKSYIEVDNQPILSSEKSSGFMSFWIENKGQGRLVDNTVKTIEIKETSNPTELEGIEDCQKKTEGSVQLIGKKSAIYSCNIKPKSTQYVKQEKTYQITSTITYDYEFTKELRLTINPTIET